MKIVLKPEVAVALEACTAAAGYQEFSGLGFVERDPKEGTFTVYDFVPMHVGSEVLTDIPPQRILPLMDQPDANNLKCWAHRHPLGDGLPGWHNWSGTDNDTIRYSPLGGIPQLVKWSISIVRTPRGWVGRVDNHITNKTEHLEVVGGAPRALLDNMAVLVNEYRTRGRAYYQRGDFQFQQAEFDLEGFEEEDEDLWEDEEEEMEVAITGDLQGTPASLTALGDEIDKAASIEDFDLLEKKLQAAEETAVRTFGTLPAVIANMLADLNERFESHQYEMLYIEEDAVQ